MLPKGHGILSHNGPRALRALQLSTLPLEFTNGGTGNCPIAD
jgi:hypothetical protein